MSAPTLTPDEIQHLMQQPDVARTLATFNRIKCYRTVSEPERLELLQRYRMFELIGRGRYGK